MKKKTTRKQYKIPTFFQSIAGVVFSVVLTVGFVAATIYAASSLTPPSPPAPQGYTLDDIYYRITEGREVEKGSSASLVPQGQIHSLEDIYQALESGEGEAILPIRTGQTVSYSAGDDGDMQSGTPRSYTDNGDGTVTDNATGLVWQKCPPNLSGSNCESGSNSASTWQGSLNYCSNLTLAGRSWRLPTVAELLTIVDQGQNAPAINGAYFPNTHSAYFWTSTTYYTNSDNAWRVSFTNGISGSIDKTTSTNMRRRCVS